MRYNARGDTDNAERSRDSCEDCDYWRIGSTWFRTADPAGNWWVDCNRDWIRGVDLKLKLFDRLINMWHSGPLAPAENGLLPPPPSPFRSLRSAPSDCPRICLPLSEGRSTRPGLPSPGSRSQTTPKSQFIQYATPYTSLGQHAPAEVGLPSVATPHLSTLPASSIGRTWFVSVAGGAT